MKKYIKQNIEPIEIEDGLYTEDDKDIFGDEEEVYLPSFVYAYTRYFIKDFIRTHNNPWVSDNFPEYIHGFSSYSYYSEYSPIYIELVGDSYVNVYEYIEEDVKKELKKFRVWADSIDHMYVDIEAETKEDALSYADNVLEGGQFHIKSESWKYTYTEELPLDAEVEFTYNGEI